MKFGLIGRNIGYSFSESYFKEKFNSLGIPDTYQTFDLKDEVELEKWLKANDLDGFNVTIPYKEEIIPLLDGLSETAEKIGAVNCAKKENNQWIGYNTDAFGFEASLLALLNPKDKAALIFGDGGAAKAVKFVLTKNGIEFQTVTRKGSFTYENLSQEEFDQHSIIINTTPLGTFPNVDEMPPINPDYITNRHLVYDLVYNPEKSKLLLEAEKRGARIKNGHEMLVLQAEKSYEIWNS